MIDTYPIRRDKHLREAQGYLELAMPISERLEPGQEYRDRFAQRALALVTGLKKNDERRGDICLLHGQVLRVLERYQEAIEPLTRSAECQPENIHTWLALGWCYKRVGRLDRAIESLEEALGVEPAEALIHYNLACYWSLARSPKLALKYLASALDIDPAYRDRISAESDFDPIRKDPSFQELVSVVV